MPVISTNTAANSALRYLNLNSTMESSSVAKLSSGSRITKASDDAAGLGVATAISADVNVLTQASSNAAQGSAIVQAADGGMSSISDILQRMKVLAAESASGSVTDTQRTYINSEFSQLISEVNSVASGTRFDGNSLLAGTTYSSGVSFLVGTNVSDSISVTVSTADSSALSIASLSVSSASGASSAMSSLDTAISTVSNDRSTLGAYISRFQYQAATISTQIEQLSAAKSAISDVDVAAEQTKLSSEDVLTSAAISALTKANQQPAKLLDLLRG